MLFRDALWIASGAEPPDFEIELKLWLKSRTRLKRAWFESIVRFAVLYLETSARWQKKLESLRSIPRLLQPTLATHWQQPFFEDECVRECEGADFSKILKIG